jgi:excisionase family DNA binding protein
MPTPRKLALCDLPDWPALMDQTKAAAYLGMGPSHFQKYVAGDLKACRTGAAVLYPRTELDAWIAKHARKTLEAA